MSRLSLEVVLAALPTCISSSAGHKNPQLKRSSSFTSPHHRAEDWILEPLMGLNEVIW